MRTPRARTEPVPITRDSQAAVHELPAEKAFVLQLTRHTDPKLHTFAGRLEHLSSGRRVRFETPEDFLAALRGMLEKAVGNASDGQ